MLHFAAVSSNKTASDFEKNTLSGARVPLSPREKEVMSGLAEGLLYKEISDKLGISYAAVHKHQHSIFKKLRATNRSEASRIWLDSQG